MHLNTTHDKHRFRVVSAFGAGNEVFSKQAQLPLDLPKQVVAGGGYCFPRAQSFHRHAQRDVPQSGGVSSMANLLREQSRERTASEFPPPINIVLHIIHSTFSETLREREICKYADVSYQKISGLFRADREEQFSATCRANGPRTRQGEQVKFWHQPSAVGKRKFVYSFTVCHIETAAVQTLKLCDVLAEGNTTFRSAQTAVHMHQLPGSEEKALTVFHCHLVRCITMLSSQYIL